MARAPKDTQADVKRGRGLVAVPGEVLSSNGAKLTRSHCPERKTWATRSPSPQNSMFPRPKGHFFSCKISFSENKRSNSKSRLQGSKSREGRRPGCGIEMNRSPGTEESAALYENVMFQTEE